MKVLMRLMESNVVSVARSWFPDSHSPRLEGLGFWFPRISSCGFLLWTDDGGHPLRMFYVRESD